jgi:hypothetical protein
MGGEPKLGDFDRDLYVCFWGLAPVMPPSVCARPSRQCRKVHCRTWAKPLDASEAALILKAVIIADLNRQIRDLEK